MELKEMIYDAIVEFIYRCYGETEDDACYDVDELSRVVNSTVNAYAIERGIRL